MNLNILSTNLDVSARAAADYGASVVLAKRDDGLIITLWVTKMTRRAGRRFPYRTSIGYARNGFSKPVAVFEDIQMPYGADVSSIINHIVETADLVAARKSA